LWSRKFQTARIIHIKCKLQKWTEVKIFKTCTYCRGMWYISQNQSLRAYNVYIITWILNHFLKILAHFFFSKVWFSWNSWFIWRHVDLINNFHMLKYIFVLLQEVKNIFDAKCSLDKMVYLCCLFYDMQYVCDFIFYVPFYA
jgi:hypothetical protein